MIYQIPDLEDKDYSVIKLIDTLRRELRFSVSNNPVRWQGQLRRNMLARAIQGSNTIEGYNANLNEAMQIVDDDRPTSLNAETYHALASYRLALTYILSLKDDPYLQINTQFLKSLHFIMMNYDMTVQPGQFRRGSVYVIHEPTGDTVYTPPESALLPELMEEFSIQLANTTCDVNVLAAMAHLNLTMIHPFKDGNGRISRALQTLVLAKNGILSPEFCSIEEWLGNNTAVYYDMLATTGKGKWSPENSALPWVRFCLKAHYQQAKAIEIRNVTHNNLSNYITELCEKHGLHERCEMALYKAAQGLETYNSVYRKLTGLSVVTASRDLKKMSDLNLLTPIGEKSDRRYSAGSALKNFMNVQKNNFEHDPYKLV